MAFPSRRDPQPRTAERFAEDVLPAAPFCSLWHLGSAHPSLSRFEPHGIRDFCPARGRRRVGGERGPEMVQAFLELL